MTIALGTSRNLKLKGAIHKEARVFSEEVKQAWTRFNLGALEKEAAHLQSISTRLEDLASPSRYPAACRLAHLLNDACDLDARLLSKLPSGLLPVSRTQSLGVMMEPEVDYGTQGIQPRVQA